MAKKEMTMEDLEAVIRDIRRIEADMSQHAKWVAQYAESGDYTLVGIYATAIYEMKEARFDIAYEAGIINQLK